MIELSLEAEKHVSDLWQHYLSRGRPEAARNLAVMVDKAAYQIERNPFAGLSAPRPYPSLARPNRAWVKSGRYWITYSTSLPPVILGVFHDSADIPSRLPQDRDIL